MKRIIIILLILAHTIPVSAEDVTFEEEYKKDIYCTENSLLYALEANRSMQDNNAEAVRE